MEKEALVPKLTSLSPAREDYENCLSFIVLGLFLISVVVALCFCFIAAESDLEKEIEEEKNYVPDITIPTMDFTVLNITKTHLSVKWDLLIRIPSDLPGSYMCLKGGFQFSIRYKGVTIASSSIERYKLRPGCAQLLRVSLLASEEDMDGVIMKDIMKDIKEIDHIRFGSRLLLPDCRYGTSGKMNYACDEAMLWFEPDSKRNAILFGDHPTCTIFIKYLSIWWKLSFFLCHIF